MNEIKKAALFSYISIVITILTTIVYTPILVNGLGDNEFALYSIVMSFASYLAILDLGLGNAVIRYVSASLGGGKKYEINSLIGMFIKMFSILSIISIILGALIIFNSDMFFQETFSDEQIIKFKIMMSIVTVSTAISLPLSVFGSILQAYEKLVIFKLMNLLRITAVPLLSIPLVILGYDSLPLIIVFSIVNISTLLFFYFYSKIKLRVSYDFVSIDKNIIKEIGYYSAFIFINVLVDQLYWNSGQIILGSYSSSLEVTIFSVSVQFVKMYMMTATVIGALFLPSLSKKSHLPNFRHESSILINKFSKYQFYLLIYIYVGFYFFGEYFINIWLGSEYNTVYQVVVILFGFLLIPLSQNIGLSILQALNKHAFRAILLLVISIMNLIACILVAPQFGAVGVAISTGISLLIGNVIAMNIYYHFNVGISMKLYWKNTLLLLPKVFIFILLIHALNLGSQQDISTFFVKIIVFSLLYFLFVLITISSQERGYLIKSVLPVLILKISKFRNG